MKQAILVTAYKNLDFLQKTIKVFNDDYTFYIHLDKKRKYKDAEIQALINNPKVKLLSLKYKVNWGSIDHLKAILYLASEAIKDQNIEYLHMITGQDFPIKSPEYISDFLTKNKGKEFISADKLPAKKWKNGGIDRIKYYSPYEIFNGRGYGRFPIKTFVLLQKLFGIKRKLPDSLSELYGGIVYWTLTSGAVKYVLEYLKSHPEILNRFKYTFCSEEILFQSVLMTSEEFKSKIQQDSLRFMIWEHRRGQSPPILDEQDYDNISISDAFFARKFDSPISDKLYQMICRNLLGLND